MPLPSTGPMSYLDLASEFGGPNASVGTGGTRSYTTPGLQTYTVPVGVTSLEVLVVGGGGAGANGVAASGYCAALGAGGGGGGWVTYNAAFPVTPGETLNVFVGRGGIPGASACARQGQSSYIYAPSTSGSVQAYGAIGGQLAGGGCSTYVGGASVATGAGGGGGGSDGPGSTGIGTQGANGGGGVYRAIPGTSNYYFIGGGGGGGGAVGGGNGGDRGTSGFGGYNGSYATAGNDGIGTGGGGGGGTDPHRGGARGGNGGVYFYAAPSRTGSIDIEDYYRGQGYVPDISQNASVPFWTSGAHPGITVTTDFRSSTNLFYFTYTVGNGYYAQDLCILQAATAQGYQNDKPIVATININGVLGASTTSGYALDTSGSWNTPPTIIVNVGSSGVISGHGGGPLFCSGGTIVGGDGGTAIALRVPATVNNNGIIQGGGAASNVFQGVYAGGAGYGYGVGVQGNLGSINHIGTLFSGGDPQVQKTGKKSAGASGYGGGWVATCGSPSTNGYSDVASYIPGNGFSPTSIGYLTLAVHGTIRGLCGL